MTESRHRLATVRAGFCWSRVCVVWTPPTPYRSERTIQFCTRASSVPVSFLDLVHSYPQRRCDHQVGLWLHWYPALHSGSTEGTITFLFPRQTPAHRSTKSFLLPLRCCLLPALGLKENGHRELLVSFLVSPRVSRARANLILSTPGCECLISSVVSCLLRGFKKMMTTDSC